MRNTLSTGLAVVVAWPIAAAAPQGTAFLEETELVSPLPQPNEWFGDAVALEGTTLLVGVPASNRGAFEAGIAVLWTRGPGGWSPQQLVGPDDPAIGGRFADALELVGDVAVLGAPGRQKVYVFGGGGGSWSLAQSFTATDTAEPYRFGEALAFDGATLVVGARPGAQAGVAYVFEPQAGAWTQVQRLAPAELAAGDGFGQALAVEGDTLAILAPHHDGPAGEVGALWIYGRSGGIWVVQQKLYAPDGEGLGGALALAGDTLLVRGGGGVHVLRRAGGSWSAEARLAAPDPSTSLGFGSALALDGARALVGAPGDGSFVQQQGAAYVFQRSGTTWSLAQKLHAAEGALFARAGTDVALDGGFAVLGGPTGIEPPARAGAAWVFAEAPSPFARGCDGSDGALASCPCGNAGAQDAGCDNNAGTGGVRLDVTSVDPSGAGARIAGWGFPPATTPSWVLLRGAAPEPTPVVFGDGLRCVAPPVVRLLAGSANGGSIARALPHGAGAGTFEYQLWYRDNPASFCSPSAAFNLSNRLSIAWP